MKQNSKGYVLITGASGFLGSYLAEECVNAGYRLLGVDIRPPRNAQIWTEFVIGSCETAKVESFFDRYNPLLVFHLAGGASVPNSVENPYEDFASLLPGTAKLVALLARRKSAAKLVFFSSAAVYGNPELLPVTEDASIKPISPYGIHKATAECLLQQYARAYSIRISVLRIFSAFGPRLRKQLMWDIGLKALSAFQHGDRVLTLFGTGQETRDFIFATDVARAAVCVGELPETEFFQVFNVASGRETTIAEAVTLLISSLGLEIETKFNGIQRAGDPLNWWADVSRLTRVGFRPTVEITEGIDQVAQWIRAIGDDVRKPLQAGFPNITTIPRQGLLDSLR